MAGELAARFSARGQYSYSGNVPVPHSDLVASVASMLHQTNGGVGYALFDDLGAELGLDRGKAFQIALTNAVWDEMIRRGWNPCASSETRLNVFQANDGYLPREIVGDSITYKKLHFDPHSIFFAHLYEPTENLQGGAISLVDVRAYLASAGLQLDEVFRPSRKPGHERRLVARGQHRAILLRDYTTIVHPPEEGQLLLIMVRNDPTVGVAHAIDPVQKIKNGQRTARRFFRTSVSPHH